jgi:ABC-type Fe3+/spermidine/putrescine transport system ATPase subunit
MSAAVSCRGVVCRLGRQLVLDGVDLELPPGESLALVGSSGSGKSTLLRIIAGLEVPERGEVLLSDQPATRDGRLLTLPHLRQVAMLFQDLALWPNLTVAGNVGLGLAGTRLSKQQVAPRVADVLKLCGIGELRDRLPGTLSGGQQQRVALARALAMQPKLLLLDEPFGGLDLLTRDLIVQEIGRLKSAKGFGLILVTHDPAEVLRLCDSIAVIEAGRIVDRASVNSLTSDAQSELGRAFAKRLQDSFQKGQE